MENEIDLNETDQNETVVPDAFGELKRLCWNKDTARPIPAKDVFAIYERNWRHVDVARLSVREKALIADLTERFGKGGFLD